jgi:hypothetical protein
MESGDWKTFHPDSFERTCRDGEAAYRERKVEEAYAESTEALAAIGRTCATKKCGNEFFLTGYTYSNDVLEKVRARLVDGNPALQRHLCVDGRMLTYQREPECRQPRTAWEKMFGR